MRSLVTTPTPRAATRPRPAARLGVVLRAMASVVFLGDLAS